LLFTLRRFGWLIVSRIGNFATGRSLPGQNKDKSQAAMLVLRA
jgi:hypothetical protein